MERFLTASERCFIASMLQRVGRESVYGPLLEAITVEDVDDGGMQGLLFHSRRAPRALGQDIARIRFKDMDGVEVMATLTADNYGDLYELDIWKMDFSPLRLLPGNPVVIAP